MKTKILAITLIAAGFVIVNLSINSNFIGWVGHEKALAFNPCGCTAGPPWCAVRGDCWKWVPPNWVPACTTPPDPCVCGMAYCNNCPDICDNGSGGCWPAPCSGQGCSAAGCPDSGNCPVNLCSYCGAHPCNVISPCTCGLPACVCPTRICENGCCTMDPGGCCTGPGP